MPHAGPISTFGTAFVLDCPAGTEPDLATRFGGQLQAGFRTTASDGAIRVVALLDEIELGDALLAALAGCGSGRLAVAEAQDEYGACWLVAQAVGGAVETLHRPLILNADPENPDAVEEAVAELDGDPREDDVAGPAAAAAAATAFGIRIEPMLAPEAESASAREEIGTVGGPFPWWAALGLPWAAPAAGEPLNW